MNFSNVISRITSLWSQGINIITNRNTQSRIWTNSKTHRHESYNKWTTQDLLNFTQEIYTSADPLINEGNRAVNGMVRVTVVFQIQLRRPAITDDRSGQFNQETKYSCWNEIFKTRYIHGHHTSATVDRQEKQ